MQELAALLRKETHALHRQVESGAFMTALLQGQLEKSAYVMFLRNLEPIYAQLEQCLKRHADAPGISPILMRPLFRLPSLHRDLEFLHGAFWRTDVVQLAACSTYVDRLCAIQVTAPERLVAHAYVRYLGDLSGGQMLQKIVSQSLKLTDQNNGVNFYNFGQPHEVMKLIQSFRTDLNSIGESGETRRNDLVDEALIAFELHVSLFNDLALRCGLSNAPSQGLSGNPTESSNPSVQRSGALG
jgi:heme oxygenase (biliverdin-producing, ferredoxin)